MVWGGVVEYRSTHKDQIVAFLATYGMMQQCAPCVSNE